MNLTFKKKRPLFYVSLSIYALLSTFIIVESFLDSGISGLQSNFFAKISSWFINETTEPVVKETIKPKSIVLDSDSSYLGKDEQGISNIALGTTTLATLKVDYDRKDVKDKLDTTYTYTKSVGHEDDYNIIMFTRNKDNSFYIDMRIVAFDNEDTNYQIDFKIAETLDFSYKFHIVDLPAPKEGEYVCKLDKLNLKIGETATIDIKLTSPNKTDDYLRRYYDVTKLDHSASNESVVSIDEYGVIHALSEGHSAVAYGSYIFDVDVSNETIVKPSSNTLSITKSDKAKNGLSLLDYDYTYNNEDNPNNYSVLLYPSFSNTTLEDQSVTWVSENPLIAKIGPYKYDENGYPVYKDEDNKYCVRVNGYRLTGDVKVYCYSNADNSINGYINLYSGEAIAEGFDIKLSKTGEISVNEQITVSATCYPKNTYDTRIKVQCDKPDLVTIINNDTTSVTIRADKIGSAHFKVICLSNQNLTPKEFDLKFTAQKAINEDNYASFHSFMRKFAGHFFLFLVTAIFGMMLFFLFVEDIKKIWLSLSFTLASGFFLAGISEIIQHFIPTRYGAWMDVGIDFLGYFIGTAITIGVILLILFIRKKIKQKKENKPE